MADESSISFWDRFNQVKTYGITAFRTAVDGKFNSLQNTAVKEIDKNVLKKPSAAVPSAPATPPTPASTAKTNATLSIVAVVGALLLIFYFMRKK